MLVSVVVPVYNAEEFVRQAVESALMQPETGEVILVEDASPDGSLQVCRDLAEEYPQVVLLQHQDGKNHGAGASRNLGIRNARFPYVAFLDADDFFLPGRFLVARELLGADPAVEGVYEAVGTHFETPEAEQRRWALIPSALLVTMKRPVSPESLFEAQAPVGNEGFCCTDGWLVKRSVFSKTGFFDEHLRLHQDAAMFVKFAAVCRMVPGRLDAPVAMRRIHDHNRIMAARSPGEVYQARSLMWGTLWRWGKGNLPKARREILLDRFLSCGPSSNTVFTFTPIIQRPARYAKRMIGLVLRCPDLLLDRHFWTWQFRKAQSVLNRVVRVREASSEYKFQESD